MNAVVSVLLLSLCAVSLPALAEKPEGVGKGNGKPDKHQNERKHERGSERQSDKKNDALRAGGSVVLQGSSGGVQIGVYFGAPQREALRAYYAPQFQSGKCPPGLAKKGNGCLPPGQAKKWRVGQPLPRDVVYYPVPNEISVRIGLPPAGHQYVRVAADILLIAIGTGMVIDAVEDLMR